MIFSCCAVLFYLLVAINARRMEEVGDNVFDLPRFLEQVLNSVQNSKKSLPNDSIRSGRQTGAIADDECKDLTNSCPTYKHFCNKYTAVDQYCPETCNKCTKRTFLSDTQCIDTYSQCDLAVKYGYCTGTKENVEFMKKYCQKSCNFCTACKDISDVNYCKKMLNDGFCKKTQYIKFFQKNCANTCGFCNEQNKCGVAKLRNNDTGIIVGGKDAQKGSYPWQAAIYYEANFLCGGTLINKRYVLTAAHCFNGRSMDVRKYKVVLGEHNRKISESTEATYYIEQIKVHENYKSSGDDHDVTLLKLISDVDFTDLILPACLPAEKSQLPVGTTCYLSGWGKTSFDSEAVDILQDLKVPIAELSICKSRNAFNLHKVTDKMACTGYNNGMDFSSACHGDSGGPLSCERSRGIWTVEGVVSWGSPLCNGLDRYTVFTRVSSYRQWIDMNTSS